MRTIKALFQKINLNSSNPHPVLKTTFILIVGFSLMGARPDEKGFNPLFKGKNLKGWTAAKSTGKDDWGNFSVNKKEKAIHVYAGKEDGSKQEDDCLITKTQFSHFILKLEYKWLENRFAPRVDWDRDAGLLFHVHDDLKRVWPWCLEMQIGETPANYTEPRRFHTGDLFVLGEHLRVKTPQTKGWYDSDGNLTEVRHCNTKLGVEKPKGEWNEMEIRVYGSEKATFILNGEVVLEIFDFVQKAEDGTTSALEKGHIGIQAEWAELLYRNIRIKELSAE